MNRRLFIKNGTLASLALSFVPNHVLGGTTHTPPSEQINVGIIGCGAQGKYLATAFAQQANLVAAADCESIRLGKLQQIVTKELVNKGKTLPNTFKTYANYQELLQRKDLDAVIIATPDHWHAIQTIHACQAGKDVYVEKPMSHSIAEGRAMTNAVTKYNRVLQVGNMQRSWEQFRKAAELVRNGYIGNVQKVRVSVGPPPVKYNLPPQTVPKTLDWEQWIGPAPMNPFNDELVFMERDGFPNWRNYREYGGGMVADWGAHMFDIAQWALDMDHAGPIEFTPPDTKNLVPLTMQYDNGITMTHENVIRKSDGNAVRFIGDDGVIDISRSFLDCIPKKLNDVNIGDNEIHLYNSNDHIGDFLNAVKTRKQPISTAEIGHRTASLCHIVNLCYELDRKLHWNPTTEAFFNDTEADNRRSNTLRNNYTLNI